MLYLVQMLGKYQHTPLRHVQLQHQEFHRERDHKRWHISQQVGSGTL